MKGSIKQQQKTEKVDEMSVITVTLKNNLLCPEKIHK